VPAFEFKEETDDIVIVAAAIGRVTSQNCMKLLDRLIDTMTTSERLRFTEMYNTIEFSKYPDHLAAITTRLL